MGKQIYISFIVISTVVIALFFIFTINQTKSMYFKGGSWLVMLVLAIIFLFLFLGIEIGGKEWINNDDGDRRHSIFVAVTICMCIGFFLALSSQVRIFTTLFDTLIFIVGVIVKYIGPVTVVALSITQIVLVSNVYETSKIFTDG